MATDNIFERHSIKAQIFSIGFAPIIRMYPSMIGLPSEPLVLDAGSDIVWKEARIYGVHGRETFASWETAKNLLRSGRIDLAPFVTHRFPFDRYREAFAVCESGESGKVLLLPEHRA